MAAEEFKELQQRVTAFIIANPDVNLEDLFVGKLPQWRLHPSDPCAVVPKPGKSFTNHEWAASHRLAISCLAVKRPKTDSMYWHSVLNPRQSEPGAWGSTGDDRGFRGCNPEHAQVILKAQNTGIAPHRSILIELGLAK
jgi:hypothetical protein